MDERATPDLTHATSPAITLARRGSHFLVMTPADVVAMTAHARPDYVVV
jgi:hypothetical protein